MRVIRSSEIGTFLYCRRAWWYRLQGVQSSNQAEMVEGSDFHARHGAQVLIVRLVRLAAWLLLLVAVVLIVVALTLQYTG